MGLGGIKMEFKEVKDSGKRQEFNTGSVRDTAEGKGMPHLIAGEALSVAFIALFGVKYSCPVTWNDVQLHLFRYSIVVKEREENIHEIYLAIVKTIRLISLEEDGTFTSAMTRLAKHYENGGKKYSKNNWRRGQPISRYYDSTMRHYYKCEDKLKDEDHPTAVLWNLIAIVQTKIDINKGLLPKELNDFPFTIEEVFPKKE